MGGGEGGGVAGFTRISHPLEELQRQFIGKYPRNPSAKFLPHKGMKLNKKEWDESMRVKWTGDEVFNLWSRPLQGEALSCVLEQPLLVHTQVEGVLSIVPKVSNWSRKCEIFF